MTNTKDLSKKLDQAIADDIKALVHQLNELIEEAYKREIFVRMGHERDDEDSAAQITVAVSKEL
jgi:hypothetical protein